MEEQNKQQPAEGNVSDAVFGTSSDAIIEGLHQGILTAQSFSESPEDEPGDRNQIVNQQDQQDITNASEDDEWVEPTPDQASPRTADNPSLMSKTEAASILSENEHLDESGDSEEGVSSTKFRKRQDQLTTAGLHNRKPRVYTFSRQLLSSLCLHSCYTKHIAADREYIYTMGKLFQSK